jgi:hypothetical protein
MFYPPSLAALLALGLLARRVITAPASTPRADPSVSLSPPIITLPALPERLGDLMGKLRELRGE